MLIKSQHIIIYYNKIFKTTMSAQILQQHFCDMLHAEKKITNGVLCDKMHRLYSKAIFTV